MIRALKLLFYYIITGKLSSIFHLLRSKKINHKDVYIKFNKYLFQKKISRKINYYGNKYFFSDSYFLKEIKNSSIDSFIKNLNFKNTFLFKNKNDIDLLSIDSSMLILQADEIMNHQFNLLGSGLTKVDYKLKPKGIEGIIFDNKTKFTPNSSMLSSNYNPINWTVDFKSGYQWNKNLFYSKIITSGNKVGIDIKVPWELSRCQHLCILGNAYRITGDEKYANEIKNQIIDWINNNPYCCGPNWVCAMDVGIRASNWLVALELVSESNIFQDKEFLLYFSKSIFHHQEYLLNNLEWRSTLTSNHYLSDIVGIFFISTYFPHFKNSEKINKKFMINIEEEIFKQTYKSGMNSEGSTSYHRLVLELFAYSALLAQENDKFSKSFLQRLKQMFRFSYNIQNDKGEIPQIGDNDSGLFFKFSNIDLLNHSYLNKLYKIIFKEDIKSYQDNKNILVDSQTGVFVYKKDKLFFLIYNGDNGQKGNGGHAHNDKLSFILQYDGKNIIVDPGTYIYTPLPEQRNIFRSTKSHNTVTVDNKEQNRFIDKYLFGMSLDSKVLKSKFESKKDGFSFTGSHDGYSRLGEGLIHSRSIEYSRNSKKIIISDNFKDNIFLKSLSLIVCKKAVKSFKKKKIFFDFGYIEFSKNLNIEKFDYKYSKSYGHVDESVYRFQIDFNKNLITTINFNL